MSKLIRAIIVDDEKRGSLSLARQLEIHCPEIIVTEIINESERAVEFIRSEHPQLIFLDIAMPGLSGLDLLKFFPEPDFKIIFVTAHSEYAVKGYKHSAVDYLLKPVDIDELKAAVNKAQKLLNSESKAKAPSFQGDSFEISTTDGIMYIKCNQLVRVEADGAYTIFHLIDKTKHLTSYNIKKYESILNPSLFMRIHKSHIINLNKVKKFLRQEGYYVLMDDGSKVEVSRRLRDEFTLRMKQSR